MSEIHFDYDLKEILSTGLLPGVFSERDRDERKALLSSYASTYLKEEIQAEALTKNIEGFSRFLFVIAAKNGEFLDYSKLGAEANITQKTASRFFEILEDTLLVHRLEAFSKSQYRRLVRHPKFYFFDVGVLNSLLGNYTPSGDRIGSLFEMLVFNQFRTMAEALGKMVRLSTYRTERGLEVDFIIEFEDEVLAVEVKASKNVGTSDLRGLESFAESCSGRNRSWVVYLGSQSQKIGNTEVLPLNEALKRWKKILEGERPSPL